MRGQKVFKEIIKDPGLVKNLPKGRSNRLVNMRNDCLLARYYYYGAFKNLCYEETIRQLVAEFFISPVTIAAIISGNTGQLQTLRQKAHVLYYFQNHWPHFRW